MKKTIAVLLYKYKDSDTIKRIFVKFKDSKPISLTGVIKDEKPRDSAIRNIKKQSSYIVNKKDLLFLGKAKPSKNKIVYLYSLNTEDKTRNISKKLKHKFKWIGLLDVIKSDDPLLHCMLYKHYDKTTLN